MHIKREFRSHLTLMHPDLASKVGKAQSRQKDQHDRSAQQREFQEGDPVFMRNYAGHTRWVPGTVLEKTGPVSARIQGEGEVIARRHHDQLRPRNQESQMSPVALCPRNQERETSPVAQDDLRALPDPIQETIVGGPDQAGSASPVRRYPTRERQPPAHLKDFKLA